MPRFRCTVSFGFASRLESQLRRRRLGWPLMYRRPSMLWRTISRRRGSPLLRPVVVISMTDCGLESASRTLSSTGWVVATTLFIRLRCHRLLSGIFDCWDDRDPNGHQPTAFLGQPLGDVDRDQAGN